MTKQERLRKSVEFLRAFAKKVKTLSKAGLTPLEFWGDVRALVQVYENQWPNWLDAGIEDVPEESTEEENFFVDNVDDIIAEQREGGGQFLLDKMAESAKVRKFNLDALSDVSACKHPPDAVEAIAALEYPGGTISWCKRCGAWHDDDACEWHVPTKEKGE